MAENRENVKISEKIEKLNQKMKELEEMIELCRKLAKDFKVQINEDFLN